MQREMDPKLINSFLVHRRSGGIDAVTCKTYMTIGTQEPFHFAELRYVSYGNLRILFRYGGMIFFFSVKISVQF